MTSLNDTNLDIAEIEKRLELSAFGLIVYGDGECGSLTKCTVFDNCSANWT